MAKGKVIVGMSGGVDSSVAAGLLAYQGYDVVGLTLNVWPDLNGVDENLREDACCALGATEDARRVADRLDIPYYVVNFKETFEQRVIQDFVREYQRGRTPNPCVRCNQFIKYDALLEKAELFGAEYVATGHYVRREYDQAGGRYLLRKAADRSKDQSYVLYVMTQDRLARTLFPLGELTKADTRRLAEEWKLPVASKPESQDICFVPYKNYGEFMERHAPGSIREGPIVDRDGNQLGRHSGIAFHTVGQRRGLGVATGQPLYVTEIKAETNTVVVGGLHELVKPVCVLEDVNFVSIAELTAALRVLARIRYRAEPCLAEISPAHDGRVLVRFDEPQRAVTPGQAVVFYDLAQDDVVVGGGTIV
jgi:tRNA-uridine 2-sulfurtransferase